MTLASWLSETKISDAEFADRIGVSRQALWRYKAMERVPRPEILSRIHTATSGAVTANDFMQPVTPERLDAMFEAQGLRVTDATPRPKQEAGE